MRALDPGSLVVLTVVVAATFAVAPCLAQEAPPAAAATETPPADVDYAHLSGEWHSEWGPVTLEVAGQHAKGRWGHGTFAGDFDKSGVLTYVWVQDDGQRGKGTFRVEAKDRLQGRWGFDASGDNGGDWTLFRGDSARP